MLGEFSILDLYEVSEMPGTTSSRSSCLPVASLLPHMWLLHVFVLELQLLSHASAQVADA